MIRTVVLGLVLAGYAGTAMADEYYIVRDPKTKHCTVTVEKPKDKMVITQIGPVAFATKEKAEGRIKKTKVCTEE